MLRLYNEIPLISEKKQITNHTIYLNPKKNTLNERNQAQKSHTVCFNLYAVLELAKLIQVNCNRNSGCGR